MSHQHPNFEHFRTPGQGMIDYSVDLSDDESRTLVVSGVDDLPIFSGLIDPTINPALFDNRDLTICYRGLVRPGDEFTPFLGADTYSSHIDVITHEVPKQLSDGIMSGVYLSYRSNPDSLSEVFAESGEGGLSVSYVVLAGFNRNRAQTDRRQDDYGVVERGIRDRGRVKALTEYIMYEIARESGNFFTENEISEDAIAEVLRDPKFAVAYGELDGVLESVVILAESTEALPWFNTDRIVELASSLGVPYESVRLAFLALTNADNVGRLKAPTLYHMALDSIVSPDNDDLAMCVECSPRSICYTPAVFNRNMTKQWSLGKVAIERTAALITQTQVSRP